jgi:Ribbon-helix-helix protein, copG family
MEKVRITVYITTRQQRHLENRAAAEGLPMAEILRRALDAYLAWDDPTYAPRHPAPNKEGLSSPA